MQCQCESAVCADHLGEKWCSEIATIAVKTIYGVYHMCAVCTANMPDKYIIEKRSMINVTH